MSSEELKPYLLAEIDEFLQAEQPEHQEEEFGDMLLAMLAMAWAHSEQHFPLEESIFEGKVRQRLRAYASLTRHPPRYHDDRIPELEFGVIHFASGNFGGQWQQFDALQNGTVAEVAMLTDAPFGEPNRYTNHCIVTFGDNAGIEYDFLDSSGSIEGGNTVRCRVPDFLFRRAKRALSFTEVADYLAAQVLAGLDGLSFAPGAAAHFHSWENGFLTESAEFREFLRSFKTLFSPYLTIGRLRSVIDAKGGAEWTMSPTELKVATEYELRLSTTCMRVIVESERDRDFYATWVHPDRVDVRSFARRRTAVYASPPTDPGHLRFLAGGRPVREKGFVELCHEMAMIRDWGLERGIRVSLEILCREQRREKGAAYIKLIEEAIAAHGLEDNVTVEPKVSLDELRERIAASSAVVVPSLYDPFCLMPTYAIDVERPAFVSTFAGVSENLRSTEFAFDPTVPGDLRRAVEAWYNEAREFRFEARYPSFEDIYLFNETVVAWG